MGNRTFVYGVYEGSHFFIHQSLEGVYKRLTHYSSDEYKLFLLINGELGEEVKSYKELYDGCKIAQVHVKSELHELLGRDFEPERTDYLIKSERIYE